MIICKSRSVYVALESIDAETGAEVGARELASVKIEARVLLLLVGALRASLASSFLPGDEELQRGL